MITENLNIQRRYNCIISVHELQCYVLLKIIIMLVEHRNQGSAKRLMETCQNNTGAISKGKSKFGAIWALRRRVKIVNYNILNKQIFPEFAVRLKKKKKDTESKAIYRRQLANEWEGIIELQSHFEMTNLIDSGKLHRWFLTWIFSWSQKYSLRLTYRSQYLYNGEKHQTDNQI